MAQRVGGTAITVTSLVGPDADVHSYQPTPQDLKTLTDADLIFINGLGLEGWMQRLIQASGTKARVVTLTDSFKARIMLSLKGVPNPHAWQNLANGQLYVHAIAMALEEALPGQNVLFKQRETSYRDALDQMDRHIRAEIKEIPEARRKVVTSHDSFGYFGAAYGITFLSPVGASTDAEPSAGDIARLIRRMKTEHIQAVYAENMTNTKLIHQIAKDAGTEVIGTLYADALSGPNGPAPSYLTMFRNNITLLKAGMARH